MRRFHSKMVSPAFCLCTAFLVAAAAGTAAYADDHGSNRSPNARPAVHATTAGSTSAPGTGGAPATSTTPVNTPAAAMQIPKTADLTNTNAWKGRPEFTPGEATAYFIWRDDEGWHVRWTAHKGKPVFTGSITSDAAFGRVKAVGAEKNDYIKQ